MFLVKRGFYINEFKQIKQWIYMNILHVDIQGAAPPHVYFAPFHAAPSLNYYTGDGVMYHLDKDALGREHVALTSNEQGW